MSKKNFDLPLGISLWPNELRRGTSRLTEGYLYSLLENSSDSYRFTALPEAAKVPGLFRSLLGRLPEESFLILEYYQEEPDRKAEEDPVPSVYYSPYMPTREILETIEPFFPRLVHDGFVGFGLANNRAGMEFFYSEEKIFTCFTGNHIQTMDLLASNGIPFAQELTFPTDLGHDHLSLLCHPRRTLPSSLAALGESDLDYLQFCGELTDLLDMYPVEENLSFFLSKKEQDLIEDRLRQHAEFCEFAEEDFGSLLLDWTDFVHECEAVFEGDLWEYHQGLKLRDMIHYVMEGVSGALRDKIREIISESDQKFQMNLVDRRKRLDPPGHTSAAEDRFWYKGVVRNQGVELRRDLIRHGWFKP